MKKFLKENITLVAAIALPLVLALVFFLATLATKISIADPQHDFLIATNYNDSNRNAIKLDVIGDKLETTFFYSDKNEHGHTIYSNTPRLWRVHVDDMSVEEISLPTPLREEGSTTTSVKLDIPSIKNLKLTSRQPGPDGYSFENKYRRGDNLMMEVFSFDHRRNRNWIAIEKNGRSLPIKILSNDHSSYYYNTRFIGWVKGEGE